MSDLPAGVEGVPPAPHRSALVGRAPTPAWRTVISGAVCTVGICVVVALSGLFPVDPGVATGACYAIAGVSGFVASKSAAQHVARAFGKAVP